MKKTYTHDEAAQYLAISATSLDDLIHSGQLPGAKISLCWIFRSEDLEAYLAEQVRIQTEKRREAYRAGVPVKVKTALAEVRNGRRRVLPILPDLPIAA